MCHALRASRRAWKQKVGGGAVFAFAGLWDCWQGSDRRVLETCTILTTTPNDVRYGAKQFQREKDLVASTRNYSRSCPSEFLSVGEIGAVRSAVPDDKTSLSKSYSIPASLNARFQTTLLGGRSPALRNEITIGARSANTDPSIEYPNLSLQGLHVRIVVEPPIKSGKI